MNDSASSILAKLKNVSNETGRSYQLCLQLFCQEEFLRRLELSKYKDNFVLKGGFLIYSLTNFDSRVTYDIDFLLQKTSNDLANIERIMYEIIGVEADNSYIKFEVNKVLPISISREYSGVKVKLEAVIENSITHFSIDFGVGDVIVTGTTINNISTQLNDFKSPQIISYSVESIIAEKLDSILYLMEFTSRMKDYYDIYLISKKFDFNSILLTNTLKKTFENRKRAYTYNNLREIVKYGDNDVMKSKWVNFLKKMNSDNIEFKEVILKIERFISIPY